MSPRDIAITLNLAGTRRSRAAIWIANRLIKLVLPMLVRFAVRHASVTSEEVS